MTVGFYAPPGYRRHCGIYCRVKAEVVPRADADEIWVFSRGGEMPPGSIRRWVGKKPLKFFAITVDTDMAPEPLGPAVITPLPHLAPDRLASRQELLAPAARAAETRSGLEAVAAKLRAGQDYGDLDAEVDRLLGTGLNARDTDVEGDWELTQAQRRGEIVDP